MFENETLSIIIESDSLAIKKIIGFMDLPCDHFHKVGDKIGRYGKNRTSNVVCWRFELDDQMSVESRIEEIIGHLRKGDYLSCINDVHARISIKWFSRNSGSSFFISNTCLKSMGSNGISLFIDSYDSN